MREDAFRDCVGIIRQEHSRSRVSSEDDLLALRDKLRERKGMKQ